MKEYEQGYDHAIDDVQEAMKQAEVTTFGPAGLLSYNEPAKFIAALKELRAKRFPTKSDV
jgi:hypothetical protein